MADVSIITPTGDRQESFALLEQWISEQSYEGAIEWIIVDDGKTATISTRGQKYIRRIRQRTDPHHTLPLNLAEALKHVTTPLVVMAEDDEWYGENYLDRTVKRLQDFALVGETHARGWCLQRLAYQERHDRGYASLCRTAWRSSLNSLVASICGRLKASIDIPLWREHRGAEHLYYSDDSQNVSMKNVPGRKRLLKFNQDALDLNATRLKQWIGEDAAMKYLNLINKPLPPVTLLRSRTGVINAIAEHINAKTYLEVGVRHTRRNFDAVRIPYKRGVDPNTDNKLVYRVSSDKFFASDTRLWDIIFIDGNHTYEQVVADIANSLAHLTETGVIVLHDCNPASLQAASPVRQHGTWNGEVYKAFCEVRCRNDLDAFCVDIDHGVGVILKRSAKHLLLILPHDYQSFARCPAVYLDLIKPELQVFKARLE